MKLGTLAAAAALAALIGAGPAEASVTIVITQVGPNVVASGSGEIDLAGLDPLTTGAISANGIIWPDVAYILVGPSGAVAEFTGASGPASMGAGGIALGATPVGNEFGVSGHVYSFGPVIYVPEGYMSDTPLSGSSTFDNQTFKSLGLTPGKYIYTWGSGDDADSLTVLVGVPGPPIWAMMLTGFAGLGYAAYRARKRPAAIA